jgi:hypothetical protein
MAKLNKRWIELDVSVQGHLSAADIKTNSGASIQDELSAGQVKTSSSDTTRGHLTQKLVSGTGITLTEIIGESGKQLQIAADAQVDIDLTAVQGDILPASNSTQNIGSPTKRWGSIYVDDAILSTNTLWLGDTPILGTNEDTIQIVADTNQSIRIGTSGSGSTIVESEKGVTVQTSGMNADVVIQASGAGSKMRFGADSSVEFVAPDNNFTGNTYVSGNFTVAGNVTFNGTATTVNSTTVTTTDNIIVLNNGEAGNGVTSGRAGIRVDRGDAIDYEIVFDETDDLLKAGPMGSLEIVATRTWANNTFALSDHSHNNADSTHAGFMSSADKLKLDNLSAPPVTSVAGKIGAVTLGISDITSLSDTLAAKSDTSHTHDYLSTNHAGSGGTAHSNASTSVAGFMSAADKVKLDGVATGANNYSLPTASTTTLGGVKVGSGVTITDGILAADVTSVAGKTGAVTLSVGDVSGAQSTITGAATTIISSNLAANRVVISDGSGKVTHSITTSTELGYLSGLTGDVQTQLNGKQSSLGFTPENAANKNQPNGYCGLDANNLVPAENLPSYVDDVLEYDNLAVFPVTGDSSKIYVAIDSGAIYRWSGSTYIEISAHASTSDAATKLATARTISLAGAASGSVSFDGSQNVQISTTINFSDLSNTPTTLSGYGITDAYSTSQVNSLLGDYLPAAQKASANGLASLNSSSLVVQNPANATATPAANKIPLADAENKLAFGWLPTGTTSSTVAVGNHTHAYETGFVITPQMVAIDGEINGATSNQAWGLIEAIDFTKSLDGIVWANLHPHASWLSGSSDISITASVVFPTLDASKNARFSIEAWVINPGSTPSAASPTKTVTDNIPSTNPANSLTTKTFAACIPRANLTADSIISLRIKRLATNGSDTYTGTVQLVKLALYSA